MLFIHLTKKMKKYKLVQKFLTLIFIGFVLSSCSSIKNTGIIYNNNSCNQGYTYQYSAEDLPKPIHQIVIDSSLKKHFSFNSLNIANAIGVLDLLHEYYANHVEVKQNQSLEVRLKSLELRQQLNQKIDFASLEISALSSEIDCEEEKVTQVASYLKGKAENVEQKLTVASIVIGAAGSILSGILINDESKLSEEIGIGVGLVGATLGVGILMNKPQIYFNHSRNILREIWAGNDTSPLFPPSIWYYINYHDNSANNNESTRYKILESWMSFEQISTVNKKQKKQYIDIYFGDGGKYSIEQLENRANMYDQLESTIKTIKQDLKNLLFEINNL